MDMNRLLLTRMPDEVPSGKQQLPVHSVLPAQFKGAVPASDTVLNREARSHLFLCHSSY